MAFSENPATPKLIGMDPRVEECFNRLGDQMDLLSGSKLCNADRIEALEKSVKRIERISQAIMDKLLSFDEADDEAGDDAGDEAGDDAGDEAGGDASAS